jgi:hypothetical protein
VIKYIYTYEFFENVGVYICYYETGTDMWGGGGGVMG